MIEIKSIEIKNVLQNVQSFMTVLTIFESLLGVSRYALIEIMTMLVYNMDHSVSAQTLDHKEIVMKGNARTVVQATVASKCAEALDTSISSTLMHTVPHMKTGVVETQHKTYITKNGMPTWSTAVVQQVSHFLTILSKN